MTQLRPGDRVRALARTIDGWQGTGTVVEVEPDIVVWKDDAPPGPWEPGDLEGKAMFCAHELAKIRHL